VAHFGWAQIRLGLEVDPAGFLSQESSPFRPGRHSSPEMGLLGWRRLNPTYRHSAAIDVSRGVRETEGQKPIRTDQGQDRLMVWSDAGIPRVCVYQRNQRY
jgi:hypothetical protein